MEEALAEVGDFKIGEIIINKVRFTDRAKLQEEQQDRVNSHGLDDTGRKEVWHGNKHLKITSD